MKPLQKRISICFSILLMAMMIPVDLVCFYFMYLIHAVVFVVMSNRYPCSRNKISLSNVVETLAFIYSLKHL